MRKSRSGTEGDPAEAIDWGWQAMPDPDDFHLSMTTVVARHTPPGARVLEIGVGPGYLPCQLNRRLGCRCVGLDVLWSAMVAARGTARQTGASLTLVQGSGFSLPFCDESFDVVVSMGVVEHFPEERTEALLREHARVCRGEGRVIVSVPNGLDFFHTLIRAWMGPRYRYHPERSYTPSALARAMRRAGLQPAAADGYAAFWSLRQHWLGYPVTAILHKAGLLSRLSTLPWPRLMSVIGNMTVQIAAKRPSSPTASGAAAATLRMKASGASRS